MSDDSPGCSKLLAECQTHRRWAALSSRNPAFDRHPGQAPENRMIDALELPISHARKKKLVLLNCKFLQEKQAMEIVMKIYQIVNDFTVQRPL